MHQDGKQVFLGLGSNQGDRQRFISTALSKLQKVPFVTVEAVSGTYESEAHILRKDDDRRDFLNVVTRIRTALAAHELLAVCLQIEFAAGRVRTSEDWLPRNLDIDILLYGVDTVDEIELKIPHPRMNARKFVLVPLCELDPGVYVPHPFDQTAAQLLDACQDNKEIFRVGEAPA